MNRFSGCLYFKCRHSGQPNHSYLSTFHTNQSCLIQFQSLKGCLSQVYYQLGQIALLSDDMRVCYLHKNHSNTITTEDRSWCWFSAMHKFLNLGHIILASTILLNMLGGQRKKKEGKACPIDWMEENSLLIMLPHAVGRKGDSFFSGQGGMILVHLRQSCSGVWFSRPKLPKSLPCGTFYLPQLQLDCMMLILTGWIEWLAATVLNPTSGSCSTRRSAVIKLSSPKAAILQTLVFDMDKTSPPFTVTVNLPYLISRSPNVAPSCTRILTAAWSRPVYHNPMADNMPISTSLPTRAYFGRRCKPFWEGWTSTDREAIHGTMGYLVNRRKTLWVA